MPRRSFIIAINTGGIVLGAYRYHNNSPVLLGFVLSFAGILPRNPRPFAGRLHMEWWLDSLHVRQCLGLEISNAHVIPELKVIDEVTVPAETGEWKRKGDVRAINAYK
ncbi:unnamed protein product, partial [Rotaria sordida]